MTWKQTKLTSCWLDIDDGVNAGIDIDVGISLIYIDIEIRRESTRGKNERRKSSRDKNARHEPYWEGEKSLAMWPRVWVTGSREREKRSEDNTWDKKRSKNKIDVDIGHRRLSLGVDTGIDIDIATAIDIDLETMKKTAKLGDRKIRRNSSLKAACDPSIEFFYSGLSKFESFCPRSNFMLTISVYIYRYRPRNRRWQLNQHYCILAGAGVDIGIDSDIDIVNELTLIQHCHRCRYRRYRPSMSASILTIDIDIDNRLRYWQLTSMFTIDIYWQLTSILTIGIDINHWRRYWQ